VLKNHAMMIRENIVSPRIIAIVVPFMVILSPLR